LSRTRRWMWCSLLHYYVFLQCFAFAQALHCQRLLKIVAARCKRIYHWPCQYMTLKRSFDLAPSKSISGTHMHESSTHWILQILESRDICDCLLPIDNRECLAWLFQIFHRSHATYSSMIFSWVACSIKSPSMLSLALINDAVRLNLLILYTFYLVTWHLYHIDDVTGRTCCDMSYHVECSKNLIT